MFPKLSDIFFCLIHIVTGGILCFTDIFERSIVLGISSPHASESQKCFFFRLSVRVMLTIAAMLLFCFVEMQNVQTGRSQCCTTACYAYIHLKLRYLTFSVCQTVKGRGSLCPNVHPSP